MNRFVLSSLDRLLTFASLPLPLSGKRKGNAVKRSSSERNEKSEREGKQPNALQRSETAKVENSHGEESAVEIGLVDISLRTENLLIALIVFNIIARR